jgi:hypothetical protein
MVQARIELEFEGLRAACHNFLTVRQGDVQAMVDEQLSTFLADGGVEKLIAVQVEKEIRTHLEQAIKDGVRQAFWDPTAKAALSRLIVDGMNDWQKRLDEVG